MQGYPTIVKNLNIPDSNENISWLFLNDKKSDDIFHFKSFALALKFLIRFNHQSVEK